MKGKANPNPLPEWKQFLRLGQELIQLPSPQAQCELINASIKKHLHASSIIWLASPFYPLPGGDPSDTLPTKNAPEIVQFAFEQKSIQLKTSTGFEAFNYEMDISSTQLAMPLFSQDHLLGVIQIERNQKPFTHAEINFLEGLCTNAAIAMQISRQTTIKNWRSEQLSLVSLVSQQIANVTDINALCQQISHLIKETFHFYYVAIFTIDEVRDRLNLRASTSPSRPETDVPIYSISLGNGMVGSAAKYGQEILAENVQDEKRYQQLDALPETQSEVALPLKVEDRILGVLDIQSNKLNAFHEFDMHVLRSLANNISIAIDGANLYSDLERRAEQISTVFEISHLLNSILDVDELLETVVETIQKKFGYSDVNLFTIHTGRQKIFFQAGTGKNSENYKPQQTSLDLNDIEETIGWVAQNGKTLILNDLKNETRFRKNSFLQPDNQSELVISLVYSGEILGILDIQSAQTQAFDRNDVSLFEALGASISLALRNATLYRSEQWRHQVADSFRDIAGKISANVELDFLMNTILNKLEENLPCEASAIWLVDEANLKNKKPLFSLRLAASKGISIEKLSTTVNENEDVRAWLEKALISTDPTIRQNNDPFGPIGIAMGYPENYSSIAAPLWSGDNSLGLLTLAHSTPGRYGHEAKAITTTFANYAAVAIQNARLYNSSQEQAWISTVLLQVAEASQAISSIDELYETIVRLTPLLVGVKKCAIFDWDESLKTFSIKAHYGFEIKDLQSFTLNGDLPALYKMRVTRSPIFVQDAVEELDLPSAAVPEDTGTLVIIPMITRGKMIGAFMVGHLSSGQKGAEQIFSQQTLSILQGITQQTSISAENIFLYNARQEEAYVTAVLLQVAQAVVSENNLQDILDTIVNLMPILVGVDSCIIYRWNKNEKIFTPTSAVFEAKMDRENILNKSFQPGQHALLDQVIKSEKMIICAVLEDQPAPENWNMIECTAFMDSSQILNFSEQKWLFGLPITIKGEILGVLVTKENGVSPEYHEKRLEILNGIAQEIALAIQNDHLQQEMIIREKLEKELQLARQIQQTFLPDHLPEVKGWQMDVRWQTALEVGGDFYDIFQISKDKIGFVIADVADKGLPAALYMTVARTLIRAFGQQISSPAAVLEKVNDILVVDTPSGMFVTTIFMVINTKTGLLTYANAGHNLPLLIHNDTGKVDKLPKGEMALGVIENIKHRDHQYYLLPGDSMLLYTDGLTESFASDGSIFGEKNLMDSISLCRNNDICQILEQIESDLIKFRNGYPPSDDLTIFAIRRLPEISEQTARLN